VIPGLVALVTVKGLGGGDENLDYNNAIPLLMNNYLPNGMLGIALTGLMASFMAGVAANVSAFNTVVTYDIVQPYVITDREDGWYLRFGRVATVGGIVIAIGTALIASGYQNLMNYLQALFSIFNSPLFATFIIGMFWKRVTPRAGFWGLVTGTLVAALTYIGYKAGIFGFGSDLSESMAGSGLAFVACAIVTTILTFTTEPKPVEELQGLVYGMADTGDERETEEWWQSPKLLGFTALGIAAVLTVVFF
jgi:SSS family solute:Na+ symporter